MLVDSNEQTQDEISPYFQCRENNKDFVYYLKGFSDGQSHFMTQKHNKNTHTPNKNKKKSCIKSSRNKGREKPYGLMKIQAASKRHIVYWPL